MKGLSDKTIYNRITRTWEQIGTFHPKRAAAAYLASTLKIDVYSLLQENSEQLEELRKIGTPPIVIQEKPIERVKKQSSKKANEKVYPKGHVYEFYKDIHKIIKKAKNEVFVVDSYADEELLNLYLEKIPAKVKIRILTKEPKGNFIKVAKKFKIKPNVDFEVRTSNDCHDRLLFIDNECWVTGQSIKDAGKKPTYLIKIYTSDIFKKVFDDLWINASKLI